MISRDDLTLYEVRSHALDPADTGEVLVLGRDAAERLALDLVAMAEVLSVSCEPVSWGSPYEADVIASSYYNGCDLGAAVLPLAEGTGLDVDPDNFDAGALLDALRAVHCRDCGTLLALAVADANAGRLASEPRCYECGRKRHFARMGVSA